MFKRRVHRDLDAVFDPACPTTEVFAPCCGRRVLADVVVDVRAITGTWVRGGNHRVPEDHDWLCDGCLHLLYFDESNDWTRSKMMQVRGAPLALVHAVRAGEHATEIDRECIAAKKPFYAQQARDGAEWALAIVHRQAVEEEALALNEALA